MAIHDYSKSISSEESNSKGGASTYEFDTISETHNLPSDKLYDIIKMLSRSLCKIRNKFVD